MIGIRIYEKQMRNNIYVNITKLNKAFIRPDEDKQSNLRTQTPQNSNKF